MSEEPKSFADTFPDIMKEVQEDAKKRELRRRELHEKDIAAEERIVAWIDILGFSEQLQTARTKEQYRDVYHKMLFVHDAFDSPSASDEPDEQQRINEDYGRTVLALSDGLVVTASPNAEARTVMTPYDLLMSFIGDIVMAQANCAVNGIFLRGGISIGPFYYENNILLSPALVLAYNMETERATHPIIIVDQGHIARLRELKGFNHYAIDAEPSQSYFQPFKAPDHKEGEQFFHLDYLRFLSDPGSHGFYCGADRKAFSDSENNSPEKRDRIFQESHRKSAAAAMCQHKEKVMEAYRAAPSDRVKEKYRWLIDYQNRALDGYPSIYDNARINVKEL